jgi:hypothetical protein
LSPFAGFNFIRGKPPVGGLRGYKGGVTFDPSPKVSNFDNPDAIIIKEREKLPPNREREEFKRLGGFEVPEKSKVNGIHNGLTYPSLSI